MTIKYTSLFLILIMTVIIHLTAASTRFYVPQTIINRIPINSNFSSKSSFVLNRNNASSSDADDALYLTTGIEAGRIQEVRKASKVNLAAFKNVESYSGYLTVNKTDNSNLFFWFFPSINDYANDPVLLWLQGGPGSSSLYGLFTENGPFSIDANRSVNLREYSWHKNYSIIYIDQPVGTGFSFTNGPLVTDETQVGQHLYSALIQFFTIFSELKTNPFFITGESYAGKFIPAIGYTIFKNNPNAAKNNLTINLKGLIIGNGLTDPINQVNYGDLFYQIGFIDSNALKIFKDKQQLVITLINAKDYRNATIQYNELIDLYINYTGLNNVYNYLRSRTDPYYFIDFIQLQKVKQALHVGSNAEFNASSLLVYNGLFADTTKSVVNWLSELLSHYRILIYSGQLDIIVPYELTENYLNHLNFSSATDYAVAKRKIWYLNDDDDEVAGYVKNAGNLTEVLVRNSGHMVPADQPKVAYELISKFIKNVL